jgi:hypothetical protein
VRRAARLHNGFGGLIETHDVREIPASPWIPAMPNSGSYRDAAVLVNTHDHAGPEWLLCDHAHPPFALDGSDPDAEQVVDRLA